MTLVGTGRVCGPARPRRVRWSHDQHRQQEDKMVARADKVEVYRDADKKWRWRRKAPNGAILADSGEAYVQRKRAVEMAMRCNAAPFDLDQVAS